MQMNHRFLTLIHSQQVKCPNCETTIVPVNSRSYVVDASGTPVVPRNQYPFPLEFSVQCKCGDKVTFNSGHFDKQPTNEEPSQRELEQAVTLETRLT